MRYPKPGQAAGEGAAFRLSARGNGRMSVDDSKSVWWRGAAC
jgi:hypothetical protein